MIPLFFTPPSSGEVCSAGSSPTIAPVDWWFLAATRRRRPAPAHVEIFAKFSKKDIRWKICCPHSHQLYISGMSTHPLLRIDDSYTCVLVGAKRNIIKLYFCVCCLSLSPFPPSPCLSFNSINFNPRTKSFTTNLRAIWAGNPGRWMRIGRSKISDRFLLACTHCKPRTCDETLARPDAESLPLPLASRSPPASPPPPPRCDATAKAVAV